MDMSRIRLHIFWISSYHKNYNFDCVINCYIFLLFARAHFEYMTKNKVATYLTSNDVNNGNKMPLKVLKVGGHEIKQHT